jgi:serine/threonine protein kinase
MPLTSGTTLGPYQIDAPLGAGGMGEVYTATDTRLDRTVAIKVLPEHVAADPDLKQRFEREARTVAALNHPHICTLHDIGNQDGIDFLVMEYLDGETLAERLEKGALPLDQALQIAIEIADALDKAHRQGIVHRDLKPGNIMLTKAGAKLLDFGLAKLKPAEEAGELSALPTQAADLTQEGSILGTFQYMAPESLEGQEADARTDIFALGAVVYELVSGRKAFEGKSQASLIAAIMHVDPPAMSSLQVMSPPVLDQIVKTCLAKDPDQRWQTAGDVGRQLQWVREGGSQADLPVAVSRRRRTRQWLSGALAGGTVAAVVTGLAVWGLIRADPVTPPTSRLSVTLPSENELLLSGQPHSSIALSPDGSRLVYIGFARSPLRAQVPRSLFLRSLSTLDVRELPGTAGAVQPFFSPDGEWVGFFTPDGELKTLVLEGGDPVTILEGIEDSVWSFGSWGEDDSIVFGGPRAALRRIASNGGDVDVLTSLADDGTEFSHSVPQFLPGARQVVFAVEERNPRAFRTEILDLETGTRRTLLQDAQAPVYASSGHLLFVRDDVLMAVPFDAETGTITGNEVPLADRVRTDGYGIPQLGLAQNGTLAYVEPVSDAGATALMWVTREGVTDVLDGPTRRFTGPRVSPDGRSAVVTVVEEGIQLLDLGRGTTTSVTADRAGAPVWTPDGAHIVFGLPEARGIVWKAADGSGDEELLVQAEATDFPSPGSWTADGLRLVYTVLTTGGEDVWVLTLDDEPRNEPFLQGPHNESQASFSPDGRWIAYRSDELGQRSVYLARYGGDGGRVPVGSGSEPRWALDGRELFYRAPEGLMAVSVDGSAELELGEPTLLFNDAAAPSPVPGVNSVGFRRSRGRGGAGYDVAPDGRFLMVEERDNPAFVRDVIVVQNWHQELLERVPVD